MLHQRVGGHVRGVGLQQSLQRGFTLLELLIAVALLALVMLGLGSSLLTVSQTQTRVDARLMHMDLQRVQVAFLRALLAQVSASRNEDSAAQVQGQQPKFFQGSAASLQWLGVMPARFGVGGRTFFRLGIQPRSDGVGQDLVLWYQPWSGEKTWVNFSQANSYVLVANVTGLRLSYQNPLLPNAQWTSDWPASTDLPSAMEIAVETKQGVWNKTVMAIYASASFSHGDGSGAVFGGTAQ